MADLLQTTDETLAGRPSKRPSKEVIERAYANDPVLKLLDANWRSKEVARAEKHKARLVELLAEYETKIAEFNAMRRAISNLRATIDLTRSYARVKPKPAKSWARRIATRKQFVFNREREKFLRQARIDFNETVRGV